VGLAELGRLLGAELVAAGLGAQQLEALEVSGVQQDSRAVEPGDLFVALRGATSDGARFAPAAVERGAVALLMERGQEASVAAPRLEVDGVRRAMARAAAAVYGRPTEQLRVVGITGTNGKTTSAHLIAACLEGSGALPGVVGTLGFRCGDLELPSIHTSPEADELQRVARAMLERGATHLVMEVSSIALAAERVAEVDFDVAVFTNLTQDHLDYHHTMATYAAAKERLFFEHRPEVAVINVDDPFGAALAERVEATGKARLLRVSTQRAADVHVARQSLSVSGMELQIVLPTGRYELRAPLSGAHNVTNVLCAAAVVEALGLDLGAALAALEEVDAVPGRLERVSGPGDDVVALVDYAHTPDALVNVLGSLRPLPAGARLWCVFGCGGDRDSSKRGPMGEAVARGADCVIVTNDNPRGEDPASIAAAVVQGLEGAGARHYQVELDRARAIRLAVEQAARGDVIVVAGKGHEPYQIIGKEKTAFDDRVELGAALAERRALRGDGG
jgi:UDP-N-acetylmuramoyl-L-alanyl-D-glutamate--2,6-diaminopimelate ligase